MRPAGPGLALHDAVGHDPQFIAVQLDKCSSAAGQNPLPVVLVDQVLLTVTLRQRFREFGHQVGRPGGQRRPVGKDLDLTRGSGGVPRHDSAHSGIMPARNGVDAAETGSRRDR